MASPREKLQSRLEMLPGLRGRAVVSHDYRRWVDGSHHLLVTLSCEESPQARGFLEVVGERAEARGWGLPLAPGSPWGMQARLDRAEEYLRRAPWGRSPKPSSSRPWPAPPPPPAPRPLHRAAAMNDRPVAREPVTIILYAYPRMREEVGICLRV